MAGHCCWWKRHLIIPVRDVKLIRVSSSALCWCRSMVAALSGKLISLTLLKLDPTGADFFLSSSSPPVSVIFCWFWNLVSFLWTFLCTVWREKHVRWYTRVNACSGSKTDDDESFCSLVEQWRKRTSRNNSLWPVYLILFFSMHNGCTGLAQISPF